MAKNRKTRVNVRWSDHEVEQLIDLIKENSCLWDVSNKDYYLRKKCERADKQIEERLRTERAVIKAKITTFGANNVDSCCVRLHAPRNKCQQVPTAPNIVGRNNVVTCCVRLHGPFLGAMLQENINIASCNYCTELVCLSPGLIPQ